MNSIRIGLLAALLFFLAACQSSGAQSSFEGTVIRVEETTIIVEPFEDEKIRRSGFEVRVNVDDHSDFQIGDRVKVTHEGPVMESHPLQIDLIEIEHIN